MRVVPVSQPRAIIEPRAVMEEDSLPALALTAIYVKRLTVTDFR